MSNHINEEFMERIYEECEGILAEQGLDAVLAHMGMTQTDIDEMSYLTGLHPDDDFQTIIESLMSEYASAQLEQQGE